MSFSGHGGPQVSRRRLLVGSLGVALPLACETRSTPPATNGAASAKAGDAEVTITRSRCTDPFQCYAFLHFAVDSQPGEVLAPGSRLNLDVSNNHVQNVVLEGMIFQLSPQFSPGDEAASKLLIRHNTLVSKGDPNSAIAFRSAPRLPVVLANNVVSYVQTPVLNGSAETISWVTNSFSSDPSSKTWFSNFDGADFRPALGSPLIAAGTAAYGVDVDIDGKPRRGHFDNGAYQR